jgi:ATP-dependent exoDNAse (exonuclease V) beta subunit
LQVQKLLPMRVQEMFARATHDDVTEAMCLLYVALTRAIHALYIVIPPARSPDEKIPRTLAGIVRAALAVDAPAPPDTVLFECGDREYLSVRASDATAVCEQPPLEPSGAGERADELESILLAPAPRRQRGLGRNSPSELEGGARVRIHHWLQPAADAAALRGTVLHACFAQVAWGDEPVPAPSLRRAVADVLRTQGASDDCDRWITEFQQLLATPWLQSQLSRQAYLQPEPLGFPASVAGEIQRRSVHFAVETECPFAIRESDGLLTGSMDRLVMILEGDNVLAADLIDFKTDALAAAGEEEIAERANFYRPQLLAYRRAIGQLLRLPPERIASRLLFLAVNRAVVVGSA